MFSNEPRVLLSNNQLADVICQLRFPEILRIETELPAQFQDAIRSAFPKYSVRKESPAPKVQNNGGTLQLQSQPQTNNYQFTSADGVWRVNLTSKFIALACTQYTGWESFAQHLDQPLAAFIRLYQPAFFERVGLRYVNLISRKALNLEGTPFNQLITPQYLGVLGLEDVPEHTAMRSGVDAELGIRGGCILKLHAGPGQVKRNDTQETETRFIFDQDLYMKGNIPVNMSAGALQTLHGQAWSIFRGAITDTLYDALL